MSTRLAFLSIATLLVFSECAMAQGFGKVFSTPAERQYLDRERQRIFSELTEQERQELLEVPPPVPVEVLIEPVLIHMGGSVRRADGDHTVWLNGVALSQSELPDNARLEFVRGLGVLRVQGLDREYMVKPGQTLNVDTGDIREDYELSDTDLQALNAEVEARDAAARPVASTVTEVPDSPGQNAPEPGEDRAALIQTIVDGLRLLQQARDAQP